MSVNTTRLLEGLDVYQSSLERHLIQLRNEFDHLSNHWHGLSAVYEGMAADDFRAHWLRTCAGFDEYVQATGRINALLQERIDALRDLDRGNVSGG